MAEISLRFLMWSYFVDPTFVNPTSFSAFARTLRLQWPPPPAISVRKLGRSLMGGHAFDVKSSITPPNEPGQPRTTVDPHFQGVPPEFAYGGDGTYEGRLAMPLRQAAVQRDGNSILRMVAQNVYANFVNPGTVSQDMLTAMTQLAVTGSNAFAAWSRNPTKDLTAYLIQLGMPAADAATANQQIMSDFNAALLAVRNPRAGIDWDSLRGGLKNKWIAVSAEDDPPGFPVNVPIAPYPQFFQPIVVHIPPALWESGPGTDLCLNVRFFIASSRGPSAAPTPCVPPGDEIVLYIHGEGSRAEEACDLIKHLFSVGAAAGRSFTVIAFDQPGCGYTTRIKGGVYDTPAHLEVASMPPMQDPSGTGLLDTSDFPGSPILDFLERTIITFVETLMGIVPLGKKITVVGGSLGGHMALRLAASQKDWVRNVIAWSPASVMDHDFSLGVSLPQRLLTDPKLAGRATDTPPSPQPEPPDTRKDFFSIVWDQDTFDPPNPAVATALAGAIVAAAAILGGPLAALVALVGAGAIVTAIESLPSLPPQPEMWYRDGWPSKVVYKNESRWDRQEVYNTNFRQWHWRICEEMIGFTFDSLAPRINKPLQLMVGEKDDYVYVHFLSNVSNFAATLRGPGRALTVQNTGHSIHNERPFFLANQIVNFPVVP